MTSRGERTLVTGWFSFLQGEATAGDVLALERVRLVLDGLGLPYDVAWSPGFVPEGPSLDEVDPADYARLLFVCGPLHGPGVAALHRRFAHCQRIAVGTSVVDPGDPAVTGFHTVLARDGGEAGPGLDLALRAPDAQRTPVVGLVLTEGQHEYGGRRLHGVVAETVASWLAGRACAPVVLDTRLDRGDGRLFSTAGELLSAVSRLDAVVTTRLHGMVLALRAGVPPIAVDPVRGGAKVTAQARACGWPAVVPAEHLDSRQLDAWLAWCLNQGRQTARERLSALVGTPDAADELATVLAFS